MHPKDSNQRTKRAWIDYLLKLAEKRKTTRTRLKECRDDEVWRKVTEGDGTMWQRFDEEEKYWRVWGGRKTGVIRQWRTRPQLMCCALACGTRCPLISEARKTMKMAENKARMYGFWSITNWSLAEAQEFLIYRNTEINGYWTQEYKITKNEVIRSEKQ